MLRDPIPQFTYDEVPPEHRAALEDLDAAITEAPATYAAAAEALVEEDNPDQTALTKEQKLAAAHIADTLKGIGARAISFDEETFNIIELDQRHEALLASFKAARGTAREKEIKRQLACLRIALYAGMVVGNFLEIEPTINDSAA